MMSQTKTKKKAAKKLGRPKGVTKSDSSAIEVAGESSSYHFNKSKKKIREIEFEILFNEGKPINQYGLSDTTYNLLITNLNNLKADRNHLVIPFEHKGIISRIIKDRFPAYEVKYIVNRVKDIYSVMRLS